MRATEIILWSFVKRFIAGKTIEDGLVKANELSKEGFKITLAYLGGEHLTDVGKIFNVIDAHEQLLEKLRSTSYEIAVKFSSCGLFLSNTERLWHISFERFRDFLKRAEALNIFVWVDAEELKFRGRTIEILSSLSHFKNLGYCRQAYNKESEPLLNLPIRICKGAYKKTDRQRIIKDPLAVQQNFLRIYTSAVEKDMPRIQVATRDKFLLDYVRQYLYRSERTEIAALLGRHGPFTDLVYVPAGPKWLDFGLRRLKEDFSNIFLPFQK